MSADAPPLRLPAELVEALRGLGWRDGWREHSKVVVLDQPGLWLRVLRTSTGGWRATLVAERHAPWRADGTRTAYPEDALLPVLPPGPARELAHRLAGAHAPALSALGIELTLLGVPGRGPRAPFGVRLYPLDAAGRLQRKAA